jgi:hypothetical protein
MPCSIARPLKVDEVYDTLANCKWVSDLVQNMSTCAVVRKWSRGGRRRMIHDESIRVAFEANGLILGVDRATAGFWGSEQSGGGYSTHTPGVSADRAQRSATGLVEQRTLGGDRYVYRLAVNRSDALPPIGCRRGRPRTRSLNAANPLMRKYRIDQ